jgi:hypothetical protein
MCWFMASDFAKGGAIPGGALFVFPVGRAIAGGAYQGAH